MEVNNNIQPNTKVKGHINSVKSTHNPSFGAGGIGNCVVTTMDAIDRGGLVASFLVQDFLGMNIPRTLTGLYRNTELTGQYNYQEAAEVAIREFVSGPTMFLVPMAMLWGIKRKFGKANDVPVKMIQAMGQEFQKTVAKHGTDTLKNNSAEMKKLFYTDVFRNIFSNVYDQSINPDKINNQASDFAQKLIDIENCKIKKPFFTKLRGIPMESSKEDMMAALSESFAEIRKHNSLNHSANFNQVEMLADKGRVSKNFDKFTTDLRNFSEDAIDTAANKLKKGVLKDDAVQSFIKHFTDLRSGSRVLANFSMLAGIIAFCSYIPKLYQLSSTNPGLNGLENPNDKKRPEPQNVENKDKQAKGKNVAFCGAVDTIGKAAAKDNGLFSKFASAFEFNSYNTSLIGFLTACGLGIVVPRLVHAREENEYKEVLFRDTTTVATVVFAAKALQRIFADVCSKVTGFALTSRPKEQKGIFNKVFNYFRPEKGIQALSSAELAAHYTNIDKYKEGLVGFMNFVDSQGGNLRKMFSSNKEAKRLIKELYSLSSPEVPFEMAENSHIISAITEATQNGMNKPTLNKLYDLFKNNKDNTFLRKAKVLNSSFNFASLFVIVPVLLGWAIPRLNEALTKKRELEKHSATDNVQEVHIAKIMKSSPLNAKNKKTNVAFEKFINKD